LKDKENPDRNLEARERNKKRGRGGRGRVEP